MKKVLLVRYGEIHLKGKNRGVFERALVENIKCPIRLVECGTQNIKITTREDLCVAEAILLERRRIEEEL